MIFQEKPEDFSPRFEAVGCFLEHNREFLILQRQDHKPQGGEWCLPGGKVDKGEDILNAIIRETQEETGLDIKNHSVSYFKELIVRYDDYDFIYHIFHLKIENKPDIVLEENGHKDFKWIMPEESLCEKNLIQNLDSCIKLFYGIK